MTPYYNEDGITIYHGDCRKLWDSLPTGAVITDPPYGTNLYESDQNVLTPQFFRKLLAAPTCAVFGWPENLISLCVEVGALPTEWITWWPTNAAMKSFHVHGLRREVECIAVFGEHRFADLRIDRPITSWINSKTYDPSKGVNARIRPTEATPTMSAADVWRDPSPGQAFNSAHRLHPNEKPVSLMVKLIEGSVPKGGLVLDPFMGSGSTLRAAKDVGRPAIGIEIEERYCETAVKRLAQGVLAFDT